MGKKVKILEEQLDRVIYDTLSDGDIIAESETITKSDVEQIAKKAAQNIIGTRNPEMEAKIKAIVRDMMKNDKEIEKMVVEVSKNVLVQLYKALWTKRNFWTSDLKNISN